jgi:hypothetical protein
MIDINLIPAALRKNVRKNISSSINLPKEILLGVGMGLILLMVTVHVLLAVFWLVSVSRMPYYDSQWQKVLPDKKVLDGIYKESGDLKNKIARINNLGDKSTLWSPKFNAISDSLPRGLWIRKMTLDKAGLTMEGSVVSKSKNEINNLSMFLSDLRQNAAFMKGFSSLEVNSIQGGKSNAIEVKDFSVVAKLPVEQPKAHDHS